MFKSTVTENFESWDKFLAAYYEPIKTALTAATLRGRWRGR